VTVTSKIASWLAAFAAVLLTPAAALAGDITVRVTDAAGKPVANAVVMIDAAGAAPRAGSFEITQKSMQFVPHVLVVPVGSTVSFGNLDPFRHHVYSFSPAKKFELKLFGQGETRPVRFDKVGAVAIGCNIHDSMQAFIQVVDTRFALKTGASGQVVLRGVPAGNHRLRVWHPQLRAPGNQLAMTVSGNVDRIVPVSVKLRRAAPRHHAY
jgi:plastocyanin